MRKVLRASQVLTLSLLPAWAIVSQGLAEDILNLNQNQTGFTLPGVTLPQGQDEVHASDGTTCRSAPFPAAAPISTSASSEATATASRTVTSPLTAAW